MITSHTFAFRGGSKYEWVDLENPSADEITGTAAKYRIDPLAVKEILDGGERPRIQEFENHTFIVLQPLAHAKNKLEFSELEVVLFQGMHPNLHREPLKEVEEVRKAVESGARAANQGPDFLFYNIISRIIDSYFTLTDSYQSRRKGSYPLLARRAFMSNLKTELEHIKHHIKYPANKTQVLAACNNMTDVPSVDKDFVTKSLPDSNYKGPEDVVKALLNKV